jgi:hypothetical protein
MTIFPWKVRAVVRDGKFIPLEPCTLPEASEVDLVVQPSGNIPPSVTDPAERAAILQEVVARMKANRIPAGAPKFTRDELHERR